MIVALTGGNGFLGRRVVARLAAAGHEVRSFTRASAPRGLADTEALRQLCAGADRLIHLASAGVQARDRILGDMITTNVRGTLNVLEAALAAGVAGTVISGTVLEYTGDDRPLLEEAPTDPTDPYGATKSAAGLLARAVARNAGHPLVYLRIASMLGANDDSDKLVPRVVSALSAGNAVELTPGLQVREWLHVEEGATAVVKALELRDSAVINIGTGVGSSVRSFLERLAGALGADPALLRFGAKEPRAGEPSHLVMDVTAAKSVLGWQSVRSIDDIVAELASSVKG